MWRGSILIQHPVYSHYSLLNVKLVRKYYLLYTGCPKQVLDSIKNDIHYYNAEDGSAM